MVLSCVGLTGASGMLGAHLLARFARDGVRMRVTSRQRPSLPHTGETWLSWDLKAWRTPAELDRLFPDVEAMIHAGAPIPATPGAIPLRDLMDASARASLCLGEWCLARGIPLVFVSGAIVYAQPERAGICESDDLGCWRPRWDYSLSKLLSEQALRGLESAGLALCILRPASIYGAGMAERQMIPRFLETASSGAAIELMPPVDDRVNLVHADDVAEAVACALACGASGVFNIAAAVEVTIAEIAETCVDVAGRGSVSVKRVAAKRSPKISFGLDGSAARVTLGFAPQVGLRQGLARCLAARTNAHDGARRAEAGVR